MKSITAKITLLMTVVLLCVSASYAQFAHQLILKVDVPFEFNIGMKTFPAGRYFVTKAAPDTLALRDRNNNTLTTFVTSSAQSLEVQPAPKVKFVRLEDGRNVLTEVWAAGTTFGYQISVPKRLVILAKNQTTKEVPASLSAPNGNK